MTLAAFLAVAVLLVLGAISPGPAVLMAARTGVTEGFRAVAMLSLGLGLGAIVWAAAALFGLNLLFQIAPTLLVVMKVAGAAFLLWLGWKMWRHAGDPPPAALPAALPRSARSALWLGFATQIANPKPAVFFGAVFAGLVPPGTHWGWIVALIAVIFVNEFACTLVIGRLFSLGRVRRGYARAKRWIDRGFGGMLALLGLKIAAT